MICSLVNEVEFLSSFFDGNPCISSSLVIEDIFSTVRYFVLLIESLICWFSRPDSKGKLRLTGGR